MPGKSFCCNEFPLSLEVKNKWWKDHLVSLFNIVYGLVVSILRLGDIFLLFPSLGSLSRLSLEVYSITGSKPFRGYPRGYLITREDYMHCARIPAWRDGVHSFYKSFEKVLCCSNCKSQSSYCVIDSHWFKQRSGQLISSVIFAEVWWQQSVITVIWCIRNWSRINMVLCIMFLFWSCLFCLASAGHLAMQTLNWRWIRRPTTRNSINMK